MIAMMKSYYFIHIALLLLGIYRGASSLAFISKKQSSFRVSSHLFVMPTLGEDGVDEPAFFQMQKIPTATTGEKLAHMVECTENAQCDVEEMMKMMDGE